MGTQNTETLHAVGKRRYLLVGQFSPNGQSAVASPTQFTAGFTAARTGTGVFVVTLNDPWLRITPMFQNLVTATKQNITVQATAISLGNGSTTLPTFTMTAFTMGGTTATDITADAGTYITFGLFLSQDTVQP